MKRLLPLIFVLAASQASAGPVFGAASYNADIAFGDALLNTSMTLAYNGANYYSSSGGSASGFRLAQYSAAGVNTGTYASGLDFRSVFTDNSGNVLARQFANNTIYKMSSPGVFSSMLTLAGSLDNQSGVDMNDAGQYVANSNGTMSVWDAAGNLLSSFNLSGLTGGYPATRGVVAAGSYLLTYDSGTLSAWDYSGTLLDTTVLNGGGGSFDSNFSLSFANNHVFVVDQNHGTWHGFDVGLGDAKDVPEPSSLALLGLAFAGLAASRKRRKA